MSKTHIVYTDRIELRFYFSDGRNARLWFLSGGKRYLDLSQGNHNQICHFTPLEPSPYATVPISLPLTPIKDRLLGCNKEQLVHWQSSIWLLQVQVLSPQADSHMLDISSYSGCNECTTDF